MSNPETQRRRDLDFYRGFTVIQMVAAHLLMHSRAPMRADETLRLFLFSYAELFSAGFLMLVGINVDHVIEKWKGNKSFNITRFYVLSSLGLFFMGWSYNLLEGTGPFTSVVQAVGIGVLVTYLFLRVGFPNWTLPLVAALFIVNYYLAVGAQLQINPEVRSHFIWHLMAGNGEMTKAALAALWPTPYFYCMFGVVPASGFVLLGVYIERLRGKSLVAACVVFLAMIPISHFLPSMAFNQDTHPVIRADLKLLFQLLPLYTWWLLTFRYLYPKIRRTEFTDAIERFGRLSLDFLVFHWIFIHIVTLLTPFFKENYGFSTGQWIRAVIVVILLYLVLPRFNDFRSKLMARPGFLKKAWALLLFCYFAAILSVGAGLAPVRAVAGVAASLVFITMYPAQRESWRLSSFRKQSVD